MVTVAEASASAKEAEETPLATTGYHPDDGAEGGGVEEGVAVGDTGTGVCEPSADAAAEAEDEPETEVVDVYDVDGVFDGVTDTDGVGLGVREGVG